MADRSRLTSRIQGLLNSEKNTESEKPITQDSEVPVIQDPEPSVTQELKESITQQPKEPRVRGNKTPRVKEAEKSITKEAEPSMFRGPEEARLQAPEISGSRSEIVVSRNVQLNIELPEEMRHALRTRALAQRSDASKVVRELIQKWLDSNKP